MSHIWSFYKALFKNPRGVGAAVPSSKHLAKTIASFVPAEKNGLIVELGPGTGVITQALLQHGISEQQIIAVEKSNSLVKNFSKKYPRIQVIHDDAKNLETLLANQESPIIAVVSSLPLLSLPKNVREAILTQIENVLSTDGLYIQYTYGFSSLPFKKFENLQKVKSQKVWFNVPPAKVYVYKHN